MPDPIKNPDIVPPADVPEPSVNPVELPASGPDFVPGETISEPTGGGDNEPLVDDPELGL